VLCAAHLPVPRALRPPGLHTVVSVQPASNGLADAPCIGGLYLLTCSPGLVLLHCCVHAHGPPPPPHPRHLHLRRSLIVYWAVGFDNSWRFLIFWLFMCLTMVWCVVSLKDSGWTAAAGLCVELLMQLVWMPFARHPPQAAHSLLSAAPLKALLTSPCCPLPPHSPDAGPPLCSRLWRACARRTLSPQRLAPSSCSSSWSPAGEPGSAV